MGKLFQPNMKRIIPPKSISTISKIVGRVFKLTSGLVPYQLRAHMCGPVTAMLFFFLLLYL